MLWGSEDHVAERFVGAGIARETISFLRDTYTFNYPGTPSEFADTFRRFYGPTMNAFAAADQNGKAEALREELEALFAAQNKSGRYVVTSCPATFLQVTVKV